MEAKPQRSRNWWRIDSSCSRSPSTSMSPARYASAIAFESSVARARVPRELVATMRATWRPLPNVRVAWLCRTTENDAAVSDMDHPFQYSRFLPRGDLLPRILITHLDDVVQGAEVHQAERVDGRMKYEVCVLEDFRLPADAGQHRRAEQDLQHRREHDGQLLPPELVAHDLPHRRHARTSECLILGHRHLGHDHPPAAELAQDVARHVVEQRAVAEELPVVQDGDGHARDRRAGRDRPEERTLAVDHRRCRGEVAGDAEETDPEVLDL